MTGIRSIIDNAVAAYIAEHPKHFTERGLEKAQNGLTRKIMSALMRSDDEPAAVPVPAPEPAEFAPLAVDATSREGRAYANLRKLAGAGVPFRMGGGNIVSLPPAAQCEAVYALADLPAETRWQFIAERKQIGAWLEFFADHLPNAARKPIQIEHKGVTGILMPWPWPPSKDGKIYTASEGAAA